MKLHKVVGSAALGACYVEASLDDLKEALEEYGLEAVSIPGWKRCEHENTSVAYDHHICTGCGAIGTDRGWGIASNRWFPSLEAARFYQTHGRNPE